MKIGIIAEGATDCSVIQNILCSLGIDPSQLKFIRPDIHKDATDLTSFGSWTNVEMECRSREEFENFFQVSNNQFIVIQLDSAEAGSYGVERPTTNKNNDEFYYSKLRNAIINKINEWLENHYTDQLFYAISIEEIDAWILTIYRNKNSDYLIDPKETLRHTLKYEYKIEKKQNETAFGYGERITEPFYKRKKGLNRLEKCINYNQSLREFVESVHEKLANG